MQDVNGDTDEMYDELINNYGKVVFSRKDKKPASAEIDDDAESLSCKLKAVLSKILLPPYLHLLVEKHINKNLNLSSIRYSDMIILKEETLYNPKS